MATEVEIVNLALSHLGVGRDIANLETDRGEEARVARRFYPIARDIALRDFPWPFATQIADLGLVDTAPNDEWAYAYRYPSDALKIRRILTGVRTDTIESRAVFRIGVDADGQLIFTDQPSAEVEYTRRVENPEFYPADFVMAHSLLLASFMAPRLTRANHELGSRAHQLYQIEISKAQAAALNEGALDTAPESEFIRVRY